MLEFITETETLWTRLAREKRPILLYGMGLGAEKILERCGRFRIPIAGVFASDDFVRGHSFRGFPVRRLSEIESELSDFIILVAFATALPDVLMRIGVLAERHTLYAPHLPVVGEDDVDFPYLKAHQNAIQAAYDGLADQASRDTFAALWNYRLSGKIEQIKAVTVDKKDGYDLVKPTVQDRYLDGGAYDGDTLQEVMDAAGGPLARMVAMEPDPKNFRKLTAFAEKNGPAVEPMNAGLYSRDVTQLFANKAGRMSALSRDGRGIEVPMRTMDSLAAEGAFSLVKLDVEGEEAAALLGGRKLLAEQAPRLIVSAYHRNEDLFLLPNLIGGLNSRYHIYLRQHPYIPAWDTNLYAVPEERP